MCTQRSDNGLRIGGNFVSRTRELGEMPRCERGFGMRMRMRPCILYISAETRGLH